MANVTCALQKTAQEASIGLVLQNFALNLTNLRISSLHSSWCSAFAMQLRAETLHMRVRNQLFWWQSNELGHTRWLTLRFRLLSYMPNTSFCHLLCFKVAPLLYRGTQVHSTPQTPLGKTKQCVSCSPCLHASQSDIALSAMKGHTEHLGGTLDFVSAWGFKQGCACSSEGTEQQPGGIGLGFAM